MLLSSGVSAKISARVIGSGSLGLGSLDSSLSRSYSLGYICYAVIIV